MLLLSGCGKQGATHIPDGIIMGTLSASLNSRNTRRARRAGQPHARATRCLRDLWSVGPNIERDLQSLGVQTVQQLARRSPERLYRQLERTTGKKQDPCVLDTFRAAVAQALDPNLPIEQCVWWYWSELRKKDEGRRQPTPRRMRAVRSRVNHTK